MKIKFLSEEALQDLRANFETYKTHYYKKDDAWFDAYFQKEGHLIESKSNLKKRFLTMMKIIWSVIMKT